MAVGDFTEYKNGVWRRMDQVITDPPPPDVTTVFGSSYGGATGEGGPNATSFARIDTAFGGLEVTRYYPAAGSVPPFSGFPTFIRDAGGDLILSFQVPPGAVDGSTPNTVNSGDLDAQVIAHFQSSYTNREIWGCYWFEPDVAITGGTFTRDEYLAAAQRIRGLKDLHAPANYHLTLVLSGECFIAGRSPAQPWQFYWDDSFEVIGADLLQHGAGTVADPLETPAQVCTALLAARTELGVPMIVAELGVRNLTVQTDQARAQWLSSVVSLLRTKASAVCLRETFRDPPLGPWSLTQEPLGTTYSPLATAVWRSVVSGTTLPPPGTGRDVVNKQLTSNVATLTTAAAHGLTVGSGHGVTINGVDATFNGTYVILSTPTATTFTYGKTAANVTSQATSGGTADSTTIVVPPAQSTWFGNSANAFDAFQTQISNPSGSKSGGVNTGISVIRSYDGGTQVPLFPQSNAASDVAKGCASYYSWTPPADWPTLFLSQQSLRDRITQFFNSIPFGHRLWFTIGHEPENNGYDIADFQQMQGIVHDLLVASNADHSRVRYGPLLTNEAFRTNTHARWFPTNPAKMDFVGTDYYRFWRPAVAPRDPTSGSWGNRQASSFYVSPVTSFANQMGKPIVIGEVGIHPDPGNLNDRPNLFQSDLTAFQAAGAGLELVCLYHNTLQPYHGPWWWNCLPVYNAYAPGTPKAGNPGNLNTGDVIWGRSATPTSNAWNDQSHADNNTLIKVRDLLAVAPRYQPGD